VGESPAHPDRARSTARQPIGSGLKTWAASGCALLFRNTNRQTKVHEVSMHTLLGLAVSSDEVMQRLPLALSQQRNRSISSFQMQTPSGPWVGLRCPSATPRPAQDVLADKAAKTRLPSRALGRPSGVARPSGATAGLAHPPTSQGPTHSTPKAPQVPLFQHPRLRILGGRYLCNATCAMAAVSFYRFFVVSPRHHLKHHLAKNVPLNK